MTRDFIFVHYIFPAELNLPVSLLTEEKIRFFKNFCACLTFISFVVFHTSQWGIQYFMLKLVDFYDCVTLSSSLFISVTFLSNRHVYDFVSMQQTDILSSPATKYLCSLCRYSTIDKVYLVILLSDGLILFSSSFQDLRHFSFM